jgi:hypothetical protein
VRRQKTCLTHHCKRYFFLQILQTGFGAHPVAFSGVPRAVALDVKQPRREADHLPPYNAEVKNEWNYTSNPVWFRGMYGHNRTLCYAFCASYIKWTHTWGTVFVVVIFNIQKYWVVFVEIWHWFSCTSSSRWNPPPKERNFVAEIWLATRSTYNR